MDDMETKKRLTAEDSVRLGMPQAVQISQLITKVKDLLHLLAGTQAGESEAVKDILYLIYKIQNEKK